MPSNSITETMTFLIARDSEEVLERIWTIGGESGWYYGTRLWKIRGWIDNTIDRTVVINLILINIGFNIFQP